MPEYQQPVIAIDVSDDAQTVLARGLRLAHQTPEKALVIHASEHPITGYGEITGKNHVVTEVQIRQKIYPQLIAITRAAGIPDDNVFIEFGQPAEVVHQFAEKHNADIIVTGSHGKHGWQLILGSTASSVLHGAPCDVLTVRLKEPS